MNVDVGISKHIHLEEDVDALLGDFWLLLEDETVKPWLGIRIGAFDSSDALSDQVLSLDTIVDGRDQGMCHKRSCSRTLLGRI